MKLFKRRRFDAGVLIEIKTDDWDFFAFLKIIQFLIDNHTYSLGGLTSSGGGRYCAFHSKEDAKMIEQYIEKRTKEWKSLKAVQPTETLLYAKRVGLM